MLSTRMSLYDEPLMGGGTLRNGMSPCLLASLVNGTDLPCVFALVIFVTFRVVVHLPHLHLDCSQVKVNRTLKCSVIVV